MDAIEELKRILECPCCFELPFPEDISIGLCSNGHYVCLTCTNRILLRADRCPVCRESGFQILRGFTVVVKVIQLLTNNLTYKCRHNNCLEEMTGNVLVLHERMCHLKPVKCPRHDCFYRGPVSQFLDDQHFPCVQVAKRQLPNSGWSFTIDLDMMYCLDTNQAGVHEHFNPIILAGKCCNDLTDSHAYVNMTMIHSLVVIFAGWLDKRDDVPEFIRNSTVELFVYVNSRSGKIGHFVAKRPKYEGEEIGHTTDGVSLARHTLYNWAEWSNAIVCPECPNNLRKPHVHVRVAIKQN